MCPSHIRTYKNHTPPAQIIIIRISIELVLLCIIYRQKMDRNIKPTTTLNSFQTHFVDIHEDVLSEGDEEGMIKKEEEKEEKLHLNNNNRSTKARETKRSGHRSFNRQVSLETGFSVLNKESRGKDHERNKALTRSGNSLGAFDSANCRIGLEGHKRDFSIFRTKSTLSKQNSLLPRKEKELDHTQKINGSSVVDDESENASVPAGRYFAALRGPELDEVKVRRTSLFLNFKKLHPYACMLAS